MTLRPEWTAPVVRAVLEHSLLAARPAAALLHRPDLPLRASAGRPLPRSPPVRHRVLRFPGPEADVEVIARGDRADRPLRASGVAVLLNSVGDERLPAALSRRAARRTSGRIWRSFRTIRSAGSSAIRCAFSIRSRPADAPFVASAPTLLDTLCDDCREHFAGVRRYLDELGMPTKSIHDRARPRLLHAAPFSRSPRPRSARRARCAAAAATTGW